MDTGNPGAKQRIVSKMKGFRGVNLKLSQYVLENYQKVINFQSLSEFARNSKVSEASIIRFYGSLGYQSYKDFTLALALDGFTDRIRLVQEIKPSDSLSDIMNKLVYCNKKVFDDQLRITDYTKLEQARDLILHAKRIEIYGIGGNGVLAMDLHHHLIKMGVPVNPYIDSKMMLMSAATLAGDALIIGISHSGDDVDVNFAMELAKKGGVKCIGVTNVFESPISFITDITLYAPFVENVLCNEPISFRYAFMNLFDALYVSIAQKQKKVSDNIVGVQDVLRKRIDKMTKGFY